MKDSSATYPTIHVPHSFKEGLEEHRRKMQSRKKGKVTLFEAWQDRYRQKEKLDRRVKDEITFDMELMEEVPCAYRFQHKGFCFCGKDAPKRIKLATLRQCVHCKHRMDKALFLIKQQDLQKKKIHEMQLSITHKIEKHRENFYVNCDPEERIHPERGYELRSDKCRNERMRNEWRSPDLCDLECPFLKKLKVKKKQKPIP